MNPFEGVGAVTVHTFIDYHGSRTRSQTFKNVKFDEILVSKGVLELETVNEELIHVPNVAYYTVEANLL